MVGSSSEGVGGDPAPEGDIRYRALMEIVRSRRSIRRFLRKRVPRELITQALEAARWAASGANIQPWEFVVVDEADMLRRVADILLRERAYVVSKDPRFPAFGRSALQDTRCFIIVLSDMRLKRAYPQTTEFVVDLTQYLSVGWAVAHLHLALATLGLGCYFNTPEEPTEAEIKELFDIPEPFRILTITPVGFPRQRRRSSRRPLTEMLHWNRYRRSLHRTDEEVEALVGSRKNVALAMSGRWRIAVEEARRGQRGSLEG